MGLWCSIFVWGAALLGGLVPTKWVHGADEPALSRYQYTQIHMGVGVRLVVYAPDEPTAARACEAAFRRFAEIEQVASDYRPTSELMRLCAKAGGPPVPVSPELYVLLERARDLSRRTDGAFDVTVGPYVALWRQARKTGRLPAPEALRDAGRRVGWRKMRLDQKERTVQLTEPGMRLDLGGIAKGYASDQAQAALKTHGVTRALVEAGGDIVMSGPPPGRDGWQIDLPPLRREEAGRTLSLAHAAVSTSGDTEQYVEIDGRRYSHVVDPRTGLGLTERISATVIARDGITADSLSTAVCVLGPKRGAALVRSVKGARVFIRRASSSSPLGRSSRVPDSLANEYPAMRYYPPARVMHRTALLGGGRHV